MNPAGPRTAGVCAWLLLLVALGSLPACTSIEVSTDYALEHDFSTYQHYAWHPDGVRDSEDLDLLGGDIFDQRLRRTIERSLKARGLRKHPPPDFYINYNVVTRDRVSINTYHSYGGYGPGWGYYGYGPYYGGLGGTQTSVYYYTQGTLVVDIVDARSNQLVWRAVAEGPVEDQATPEKREQHLHAVVEKMFAAFPPGKS